MEKFNEEIYKGIVNNGKYEDEYCTFMLIDANHNDYNCDLVLKAWKSSYFTSLKYEFFGVLDKKRKDIFTPNNIETIRKELLEQAKKELTEEILKEEEKYINIQKKNFDEKIKNDDFKLHLYNNYLQNDFKKYYILGKTPKEIKDEQMKFLFNKNLYDKETDFILKYLTFTDKEIKDEFKERYKNGKDIDKWEFNYKWNNEYYGKSEEIEVNYINNISLYLNRVDYFVNEYKKVYEDPSELLQKNKNLYIKCKNFYEENQNKSCKIYLKNDLEIQIDDFRNLFYTLENGNEKIIIYCITTNKEIGKLKEYNTIINNEKYDDDLHIKDIKKITFRNKTIYEEE